LSVVECLLQHDGVDVNVASSRGGMPLVSACLAAHWDVVECLLQHDGVDVNVADSTGQTPLHVAVGAGHLDVVVRLVANGGDVNAADSDGETPLYFACVRGHKPIVKHLIEQCGVCIGDGTVVVGGVTRALTDAAVTSDAVTRHYVQRRVRAVCGASLSSSSSSSSASSSPSSSSMCATDALVTRVCAACRAVYYCSETCQHADWSPHHRAECAARRRHRDAQRTAEAAAERAQAKARRQERRRRQHPCATCGALHATLQCSRCDGVDYCNVACQRADWASRHRAVCAPRRR
jgi:hypothetical protein